MAKPSSRQELIDYCLRQLGEPVLEINVDDDQIEDAVDDLRTFRDDKQKELDDFEKYYSPGNKSIPSENIVMPVADPVNT